MRDEISASEKKIEMHMQNAEFKICIRTEVADSVVSFVPIGV